MNNPVNSLPAAVVIGLDSLPGLQTARILAKHNIPVIGIARFKNHFAIRTNACKEVLFADTQSEDFIKCLQKLGLTLLQKAVLFPCTDMSVLLISQNRKVLEEWFYVALAENNIVEMLLDKLTFYALLDQYGLPYPKTFVLHSLTDAEKAQRELLFPVILKPTVRRPSWTKNSPKKVFLIKDRQEFLEIYKQCHQWADALLAQEWVDGPDENLFSCNAYFNKKSEPLVTFIAKKIRQFPPLAGIGALGIECRNDEVLRTALTIFTKSHFYGLGYIEMKYDTKAQKYFIMEANVGRPTVRSALAETANVEILYTMYCDVLGFPLPTNRTQQYTGIKWLNIHHDLRASWYYWRKGQLSFLQWVQSLSGPKHHAVFSWRDPIPFFVDILSAIKGAIVKRLRCN